MVKNCLVNIKGKTVEAIFIGIFQHSDVIGPSAMIGGHGGGTVAYPVAVVRIGDKLKQIGLKDITLQFKEEDM